MKTYFISSIVALCVASISFAADYEPTDTWPYFYYDFEPAVVYYRSDAPASARINIHLMSNKLHFTDEDKVMEVRNANQVDSVVCENGTVFVNRGNLYIERIARTEHIIVGRSCEVDVAAMSGGSGAYGMSTTSSAAQSVASYSDHSNMAARRYNEMKINRASGSFLPTTKRTCFVINGATICHATKNGVNKILTKEEREKFKIFLKENKIKWKEVEGLMKVAEFLEKEYDFTLER